MLLEALRLALAAALLIALPGWLLLHALFPQRERLSGALKVYVIIGGGILITMLVASILGFIPHAGGRGWLQTLGTGGMPNLELAILATCFGLFVIGVRRGAHVALSRRYPRLAAPWGAPAAVSKAIEEQR